AHRRGDECHCRRNHAPRDHDPRHPSACADAMQNDVAGDFHEEVRDEEEAGAQPVDGLGEMQILGHPQLGEADIDPIQICNHITQQQEGKDPPSDLS
ncbi:hypothetical protein DFQ30_005315, partial [Apophysomyces sp. BC1015]